MLYEKLWEKIVFHTIKCKYMSLNVGVELPIWKANGHVSSYSVFNPGLSWKCSSNVCAQALVLPKMILPYTLSA